MGPREPKGAEFIKLVRACVLLHCSYRAGLDRVLRGDVDGYQDGRGRWWVDLVSLRRFVAAQRRVAERRTVAVARPSKPQRAPR